MLVGTIVVIIVLLVMTPSYASPEWVFTSWQNLTGYNSPGLAFLLGLLQCGWVLVTWHTNFIYYLLWVMLVASCIYPITKKTSLIYRLDMKMGTLNIAIELQMVSSLLRHLPNSSLTKKNNTVLKLQKEQKTQTKLVPLVSSLVLLEPLYKVLF